MHAKNIEDVYVSDGGCGLNRHMCHGKSPLPLGACAWLARTTIQPRTKPSQGGGERVRSDSPVDERIRDCRYWSVRWLPALVLAVPKDIELKSLDGLALRLVRESL